MIVVSDTSPLSYFHQIGRLALLQSLYEEIIIPHLGFIQRYAQKCCG